MEFGGCRWGGAVKWYRGVEGERKGCSEEGKVQRFVFSIVSQGHEADSYHFNSGQSSLCQETIESMVASLFYVTFLIVNLPTIMSHHTSSNIYHISTGGIVICLHQYFQYRLSIEVKSPWFLMLVELMITSLLWVQLVGVILTSQKNLQLTM